MTVLSLAIGLGLAISLLFSEAFGVAAGGMVVPGYLALYLNRPMDIVLTFVVGLAAYIIVQSLSSVMVVYGRRRTVLMILVAYLLGLLARSLVADLPAIAGDEANVIGYIIPGLLAIWFARQGVVETVSTALTSAVIVRLLLIIFIGEELLP